MTNRLLKCALYAIVICAVVVAVCLFLGGNQTALVSLKNISVPAVFSLIALRLACIAVNGLCLQACTAAVGARLRVVEGFGLSVISIMGNMVTPFSGGTLARIGYLRSRRGISLERILVLLAAGQVVAFMTLGVCGIGLLLTVAHKTAPANGLFVLLALAVVVPATIIGAAPAGISRRSWWSKPLSSILQGWTIVSRDRLLIARIVLYTMVNILLTGISFWIVYRALGVRISLGAAALIGILSAYSGIMSITPGGLGVQEVFVGICSGLLGPGFGLGLLATVLLRAATIVPAVTLGPVFSILLARHRRDGAPLTEPESSRDPLLAGAIVPTGTLENKAANGHDGSR